MTKIVIASSLQRHVACPELEVAARSVREAVEQVFSRYPRLRGYVLDDQQVLRRHMMIFVDGQPVRDRTGLGDAVSDNSTIYLFQALSGGSR